MAGGKWPQFPSLVHPYERQNVGLLAMVFGVLQALLQPFNTFMGLDDQGNWTGREELVLLSFLL